MATKKKMGCSMKTLFPHVAQAFLPVFFAAGALHAATFYVTVAGLGGEPEYEQRFASQAQEVDKLVRAGGPDAKVTTLSGAQATKANIQSSLAQIAKEAKPADALVVM